MLIIKFRYKAPKSDVSKLITHPVLDNNISLESTSDNFKFSAAVAEFGLLLRNSSFKENASYTQTIQLVKDSKENDEDGYRAEFLQLVKSASLLAKSNNETASNNE